MTLIMLLLVLMIVVQVLELFHNHSTLRLGVRTLQDNLDIEKDRRIMAEKARASAEQALEMVSKYKISDTAFAITPDGVKALPEDWVDRCFPPTKPEEVWKVSLAPNLPTVPDPEATE